jgi:subtilisin family serine protease
MRKKSWLWTNVVVVAGIGVVVAAAAIGATMVNGSPEPDESAGDIVLANATNAVTDSYVVVFKRPKVPGAKVGSTARDLSAQFGGQLGFTYSTALRGFSVTMAPDQARKLAKHPSVAYVQQNQKLHKYDGAGGGRQDSPPWSLDRIDQRKLPLDKAYQYPTGAADVTTYVIDTGIRITHTEFAGRASHGYDFVDNDPDATDCEGHGTHVAGTAAGATTYSVAKLSKVVAVRVLSCEGSGTTASVVSGINWVAENATGASVANMSLGGGADPALDEAVNNAIAAGVTFVVAAGNENADACNSSPARVPDAITVGSIGKSDARSSFSNYGKCVDIFAPGEEILSLGIKDDNATETLQGTSMASPHVAGAAAMVLAQNPKATPEQVTKTLLDVATPDVVTEPGAGSPDKLLHTGAGKAASGLECTSGGDTDTKPDKGGLPGGGMPGGGLPGGGMPGAKPSPSASTTPRGGGGESSFTCTVTPEGTPKTIKWTVNDTPVPQWKDLKVTGKCTVDKSYTIRVDLTGTNPDSYTTTVKCAG